MAEGVDFLVALVEEARGIMRRALADCLSATEIDAWLDKARGIYALDEKNEREPLPQCALCGGNARKCGCPR